MPQVHRASLAGAPDTVSSQPTPTHPPVRAVAHWDGSAGHGTAPAALTASDLPGLVDHVVREIDRRVVAARERRGWTS